MLIVIKGDIMLNQSIKVWDVLNIPNVVLDYAYHASFLITLNKFVLSCLTSFKYKLISFAPFTLNIFEQKSFVMKLN